MHTFDREQHLYQKPFSYFLKFPCIKNFLVLLKKSEKPTLLLALEKSSSKDASILKQFWEKETLECSIKYVLTQPEMLVKEKNVKQPTTALTSSQWQDWHSKSVLTKYIP